MKTTILTTKMAPGSQDTDDELSKIEAQKHKVPNLYEELDFSTTKNKNTNNNEKKERTSIDKENTDLWETLKTSKDLLESELLSARNEIQTLKTDKRDSSNNVDTLASRLKKLT